MVHQQFPVVGGPLGREQYRHPGQKSNVANQNFVLRIEIFESCGSRFLFFEFLDLYISSNIPDPNCGSGL